MKTYPTQHVTTYNSSNLNSIIALNLGKTGKIRVAQVGAGVVILPETNCTQDLCDSEMRKALHIDEKTPKEEKMTNYKIEDSDSWSDNTFFVSLTEEQVRLLDWLIDHEYVDCDLFHADPNIEFERI